MKKIDEKTIKLMKQLRDRGNTINGIAKELNISNKTVQRYLSIPVRRIIKEEESPESMLENIYKEKYLNDLSSCILIAHEIHSKYPKLKYDPALVLALQKKYLTPTGNGEWEMYLSCNTNEDIDHLIGGKRALF